jgi:hypothetical protein
MTMILLSRAAFAEYFFDSACLKQIHRLGYSEGRATRAYDERGIYLFMGAKGKSMENLRPFFLDCKTSQVLELIPEADFVKIHGPQGLGGVVELSADRKREIIAINMGSYRFVGEGKDKKQIATSIILVYSAPDKRIVFREDSDRYWTEMTLSPDGRYPCGYTHPPNWLVDSDNFVDFKDGLMGYQVEVIDLGSGQKQVLAPECLHFPLSARFYWSEDSKELLFPHRASGETKATWKTILKKWNVQDSPRDVKEFLLEGERRYLDKGLLLPDHSLALVASREMLTLDRDFRNPKTLFVPEKDYWFDLDSVQCGPSGLSFQTWTRDKSSPSAEKTIKKVTPALAGNLGLGEPAADPVALLGFRQVLPKGVQRSEFPQEHKFVDLIVTHKELKEALAKVLAMLARRETAQTTG